MTRPFNSWQYLGQPLSEWPKWLWFKNCGRNEDHLVIHQLEGTLRVEIGDWIDDCGAAGVFVRKPNPEDNADS